jgi:hypothetical protein
VIVEVFVQVFVQVVKEVYPIGIGWQGDDSLPYFLKIPTAIFSSLPRGSNE